MIPTNTGLELRYFVPSALDPIPECSICLTPSVNPIGHKEKKSEKLVHLHCLKCMQNWAENNATCPECRVPIKISHLESFKDKVIRVIKKTTPILIFLAITIVATRIFAVPYYIPIIGIINSLVSSALVSDLTVRRDLLLRRFEERVHYIVKTFTTLFFSSLILVNIACVQGIVMLRGVQFASLVIHNHLTSSRGFENGYKTMYYIGFPLGLLVATKVYGAAVALFLFATHAREVVQGIHAFIEITIREGRARFVPQV